MIPVAAWSSAYVRGPRSASRHRQVALELGDDRLGVTAVDDPEQEADHVARTGSRRTVERRQHRRRIGRSTISFEPGQDDPVAADAA